MKGAQKEKIDAFFDQHYNQLMSTARYISYEHAHDIVHEVYVKCVERGYEEINYTLFVLLACEVLRNLRISEVSVTEDSVIITPRNEKTRERLSAHFATPDCEMDENKQKVAKAIRKLVLEHKNGRQRCLFLSAAGV